MTIRTILVGASGGSASDGALDIGCGLATRFGAHLEALHVRADIEQIAIAMSDSAVAMPFDSSWMSKIKTEVASKASGLRQRFAAKIAAAGIAESDRPGSGASAAWRDETGDGPLLLALRARFFDLVVLGRSERVVKRPHSDAVEEVLLQSGRAVLLAPARPPTTLGERVLLGWDGSVPAARAMQAALPILAAAKSVQVATVGAPRDADPQSAVSYLAWHGIQATTRSIASTNDAGPGRCLLDASRDEGADLLVMGGFAHAPWREALFGGATHDAIGAGTLPILLSH